MTEVAAVAGQFALPAEIVGIREFGAGNINDTFLVDYAGGGEKKIILQRINDRVFPHPEEVMENLCVVTEHMRIRSRRDMKEQGRGWEVLRLFAAKTGKKFVVDPEGGFWRAVSFVENATSYETIKDDRHALEAGRALGRFHCLVSDLDPRRLHDILPGFHITPDYITTYHDTAMKRTEPKMSGPAGYCVDFVENRQQRVSILEEAKEKNILELRVVHGDPKISNIMIDDMDGRAVSLVDLDTVKPGLIHYDIGDCLRSCCNPLGEETRAYGQVHFDLGLCRAILKGYFSEAGGFLGDNDYEYLYDAVRLLAFELGLRFFTDYLAGNVYFKTNHREHNLHRALVQFKLTESIEAQEAAIRKLVSDLRTK